MNIVLKARNEVIKDTFKWVGGLCAYLMSIYLITQVALNLGDSPLGHDSIMGLRLVSAMAAVIIIFDGVYQCVMMFYRSYWDITWNDEVAALSIRIICSLMIRCMVIIALRYTVEAVGAFAEPFAEMIARHPLIAIFLVAAATLRYCYTHRASLSPDKRMTAS